MSQPDSRLICFMRWHLPVFTPQYSTPWHEFAYLNTRGNHGLSVIKLNAVFWPLLETVNVCCSIKGTNEVFSHSFLEEVWNVNSSVLIHSLPHYRALKKASFKARWRGKKPKKSYFFPGYLIKMFPQQIFGIRALLTCRARASNNSTVYFSPPL